MVRRWGVANIVNKRTGDKFTIKSTDLDKRVKDYFESLEDGVHFNKYLQHDFNRYGMENFEVEIIADDCTSKNELNRIGNLEIRKNGLKSYNQRTANESFTGGNSDPPNPGRRHDELLEYLSQYIDIYTLRESSKKEIELRIKTGDILSKEELLNELGEISQKDKLLNLIKFSNLNPKDKQILIKKVQNKQITNEVDLNNQIKIKKESCEKFNNNKKPSKTPNSTKKNNRKTFKTSNSNSSRNKNKKPKKTFQDKVSSNYIKLERQPVSLVNKCPVCSNRVLKNDIYCAECGHKLKDKSYPSGNTNLIIAKLFMIEDGTGNLRYSVSKTFGFVILIFFIIADIIVLLFGIPSTKLYNVTLITIGGLSYYVLFRLAGIIFRKLSK